MIEDYGLMWYEDNPKKSLQEIIIELKEYYKNKYDKIGNVCYVNSKIMSDEEKIIDNVKIKSIRSILPNHYFMGQE